jgi:hypothetical protein
MVEEKADAEADEEVGEDKDNTLEELPDKIDELLKVYWLMYSNYVKSNN